MGKMALCGEFTRVMVQVLRDNGVPARRLYLFGKPGTSHVLFEYFNATDDAWYIVNSFAATDYVNEVFNERKIGKDTLFDNVDAEAFVYTEVTTLNKQLRGAFGDRVALPYWLSVLIDEPNKIKIIVNVFSLVVLLGLFAVCDRRVGFRRTGSAPAPRMDKPQNEPQDSAAGI